MLDHELFLYSRVKTREALLHPSAHAAGVNCSLHTRMESLRVGKPRELQHQVRWDPAWLGGPHGLGPCMYCCGTTCASR
eukprot:6706587-Prymnesium_polylepis.2